MAQTAVPTDHARLSASGAHKWMHCAGSIAAEAPYPDTSSKYADEGTAAHTLASGCLENGREASSTIGMVYRVSDTDYRVTADMAEHVQTYLDFVRSLWAFCDVTWIERKERVPDVLAKLPEEVGGTSDAGGIDYGAETLHVTDLKFGRGVLVEVTGNAQFRIYALGAYGALGHEDKMRLRHVAMHVIQPRAEHPDGPIRTETITVVDLLNWARETLGPAAYATLKPDAPRTAGDWCKFCKAKGACATFRDAAFTPLPFVFEEVGTALVAPDAPAMTPARVGEIYAALDRLEEWMAAFRGFVFHEVSHGRPIPGVALKRKRTNRAWLDERTVRDYFTEILAGRPMPLLKQVLRSPADIEKECKTLGIVMPEHLVIKTEGELTLCVADDPHALPLPSDTASHFPTFMETP